MNKYFRTAYNELFFFYVVLKSYLLYIYQHSILFSSLIDTLTFKIYWALFLYLTFCRVKLIPVEILFLKHWKVFTKWKKSIQIIKVDF